MPLDSPSQEYSYFLPLQLLIEIFTIGIFSVQGGAKAWFEFILVTATLFACGYLLWWEVAFILIALILGAMAAGMFTVLAPQYLVSQNPDFQENRFSATQLATDSFRKITEAKIKAINLRSGQELLNHQEKLNKAVEILHEHTYLIDNISELREVFGNTVQEQSDVNEKVQVEYQVWVQTQQQEAESYRRQEEVERQKERQEAESRERRREAEQESQSRREAELFRQRKREGFTGGCPPDSRYNPPMCPPGYPIKVTLNNPNDGYDGIIWKATDSEYSGIRNVAWCFESVEAAKVGSGKHKLRRPKDRQGRLRP